ncbi:MAG: 1-acyl-sn-glycerol-3-phosphate acyltransferase [Succinivibrionaceae bacterium]|nr:1-acyl-sn-glycerol-3-phosphate acyltransferase [Succinivibrionaceae bacterium]
MEEVKAAETSSDSRFDGIRPYRDDEVGTVISRILADESFLTSIVNFQYRRLRLLGPLLKPLIRRRLQSKFGHIASVAEFQDYVAVFMENMIKNTTDGVSFEGFDRLEKGKGYLFISNHRDIALDPAFIDLGLHRRGLDTVRIAIGDNLLRTQLATDLMKLNQSFVVDRSSKGRELLASLSLLSDYIRLSLSEGHSIWIAQREGRAKDGNDQTDPAILKMFHLAGRKLKIPFSQYVKQLNIVPVAISYEYDPGDQDKAHELYMKERDGSYEKSQLEDIQSIVNGIQGYKGRISVRVGEPLKQDFATVDELARHIDEYIHGNYHLYPSNLAAAGRKCEPGEEKAVAAFEERLAQASENERELIRSYYARPVINSEVGSEDTSV